MSIQLVAIVLGILLLGGWFAVWLSLREPEIPIATFKGITPERLAYLKQCAAASKAAEERGRESLKS
jgi:hypothetical protein